MRTLMQLKLGKASTMKKRMAMKNMVVSMTRVWASLALVELQELNTFSRRKRRRRRRRRRERGHRSTTTQVFVSISSQVPMVVSPSQSQRDRE